MAIRKPESQLPNRPYLSHPRGWGRGLAGGWGGGWGGFAAPPSDWGGVPSGGGGGGWRLKIWYGGKGWVRGKEARSGSACSRRFSAGSRGELQQNNIVQFLAFFPILPPVCSPALYCFSILTKQPLQRSLQSLKRFSSAFDFGILLQPKCLHLHIPRVLIFSFVNAVVLMHEQGSPVGSSVRNDSCFEPVA